MKCPRDESELEACNKGPLSIEQCAECNGFFVNLAQQPANQLSTLLKRDISIGSSPGLMSPTSSEAMLSFVYRGVLLDYCEQSHSVWFDHGEYTKMFAAPPQKPSKPTKASESDSLVSSIGEVAADSAAEGVFGFVGDLVGDLVSGIDIF